MNACVEALYFNAIKNDFEVFAAISGYDGLVNDRVIQVQRGMISGISHMSGCNIKSGRSAQFATTAGFNKALLNIRKYGFDCLVIIGGNGTFAGCARLKGAGINVFGIPATIDNDVAITNSSLGFSSACENAVQLIDMLKATMRTNDRDHIVTLMGRKCAALANVVGEASFADVIDSVEQRHTPAQVAKIFAEKRKEGATSCLMIKQEIKADDVAQEAVEGANFVKALQIAAKDTNIRMNTLGHLQRGATPSCRDRWLAQNYARVAMNSILNNQFGVAAALFADEFKTVEL